MYFEKFNGKEINEFSRIVSGEEIISKPVNNRKYIYEVDYRGEYSVHWVVIYDLEGNEITRYNDRYLLRIDFNLGGK